MRWPPFILCLLIGKNAHIILFSTDVPVLVINLFQHKDNHICSHSQHPIALLWYGIITVNMFWIIEILFAFFTLLYNDTTCLSYLIIKIMVLPDLAFKINWSFWTSKVSKFSWIYGDFFGIFPPAVCHVKTEMSKTDKTPTSQSINKH